MKMRPTAYGPRERLLLKRVQRVEWLVDAQRRRLLQYEASGMDLVQPRALLKLMEAVAEQFQVAWGLACTFAQSSVSTSSLTAALSIKEPVSAVAVGSCGPAATVSETLGPERRVEARRLDAQVPCPHCGLVLQLGAEDGALMYNVNDWAQRCRYPGLQTPALCQLLLEKRATLH